MRRVRVFLDSDVVISSMLSKGGASSVLIKGHKLVKSVVSNYSVEEILQVSKRLEIPNVVFKQIISKLEVVEISDPIESFRAEFSEYVFDPNDAHIVGSAVRSVTKFLITFNLKHYNLEKIKSDFGIITLTPGSFLQYIRGIEVN